MFVYEFYVLCVLAKDPFLDLERAARSPQCSTIHATGFEIHAQHRPAHSDPTAAGRLLLTHLNLESCLGWDRAR